MEKYAVGINLWLPLGIFQSEIGTRLHLREIHDVRQTGVKEDYELVFFEIVIFHSLFYSLLLNDAEFGRVLSEGVCALAVDFKEEIGWKNEIIIYDLTRTRGRKGKLHI